MQNYGGVDSSYAKLLLKFYVLSPREQIENTWICTDTWKEDKSMLPDLCTSVKRVIKD